MKTYTISIEGQTIQVPDAIGANDDAVRAALAPYYPDAAGALISRSEKTEGENTTVTVSVVKKAGSKGLDPEAAFLTNLRAAPAGENPAIALYKALNGAETITDPAALLALEARIATAIEQGEAQGAQVDKARARLTAAHAVPALFVVEGF
jgi:hypothetical protein